jgi:hypothetical protein
VAFPVRYLLVLAVVAVTVCVLCGVAVVFASGSRGFFSPDTLETRTQRELLLPMTELPLFRSRYEVHRYKLVDYLVAKGYWAPNAAATPRWLPVFHYNEQWRDGHSNFHSQSSWTMKSQQWIDWSEENPEVASELWPRVLAVLRSGNEDAVEYASYLMWDARESESLEGFHEAVAADKALARLLKATMPWQDLTTR